MPLEVIGAGLGRTGTASLRKALETLYDGGPCYHMDALFEARRNGEGWHRARVVTTLTCGAVCIGARPRRRTGRRSSATSAASTTCVVCFGRRDAFAPGLTLAPPCGSQPLAAAWEALLARSPNAKVILTVRSSPEAWAASAKATILNRGGWGHRVIRTLLEVPFGLMYYEMFDITAGEPGWSRSAKIRDDGELVKFYTAWNARVRRRCPADRLLVYEVSQGWEPLCAFLGKAVPTDAAGDPLPFPRVNDTASFRRKFHRNRRRGWLLTLFPLTAPWVLLRMFVFNPLR